MKNKVVKKLVLRKPGARWHILAFNRTKKGKTYGTVFKSGKPADAVNAPAFDLFKKSEYAQIF